MKPVLAPVWKSGRLSVLLLFSKILYLSVSKKSAEFCKFTAGDFLIYLIVDLLLDGSVAGFVFNVLGHACDEKRLKIKNRILLVIMNFSDSVKN